MLTPRKLIIASLVLLASSFSAQAHPEVSGHIVIGDGPLHLGIDLGHWHGRHHWPHGHIHGAGCYRRYPHGHRHWAHYPPYDALPHRDRRHGPTHRHRRGSHMRGPHQPPAGHRPQRHDQRDHDHDRHDRHERRHRHTRDCYLHYPRGHAHWKD